MSIATVIEYAKSETIPLVVEFFYEGEKINDPATFFEENPSILELFFPSPEEIQDMINKKVLYYQTHKLVISDYGFHLIQL